MIKYDVLLRRQADLVYNLWKFYTAWVMGFIDPRKPYGRRLFEAIIRLAVSVGVNVGCIRREAGTGRIQVALIRRGAMEFEPNTLALPGGFYRPFEMLEEIFKRLLIKELGDRLKFEHAVVVGTFRQTREEILQERGHALTELIIVLRAELSGGNALWYYIDDPELPERVLGYHWQTMIPGLVAAFRRYERFGIERIPKVEIVTMEVK